MRHKSLGVLTGMLALAGALQLAWAQSAGQPAAGAAAAPPAAARDLKSPAAFDVRTYGAAGDGKTVDTPAINKAIDAASAAGGGTVYFPAGNYLSVSIHLKSNVALYLEQGCTIVAADPKDGFKYDDAEPNPSNQYQDFGHTHWHNSLIWGENLENVSILGPGKIWGKGLVRSGPQSRPGATTRSDSEGTPPVGQPGRPFGYPNARDTVENGWGNKSIALKLCRNVILKDFSILHGGHFAILATGVDNFTCDNLKIDTNRDGIDFDCCRNVRVSNCSVNSPFDDGICPKSSYALGYARDTENVTITNCQVSGYDEGTFLDGTYKREHTYKDSGPTGRIKCGTESNGGFKNITISNCVFAYCRGLALESVDGAKLEDVTIDNITMRDITNSPIFLRLGARLRGPEDSTQVGTLRRIIISNVVVYNASTRYSSILSGVPGHDIEDVTLSNIRIYPAGGGSKELATTRPAEKESAYPEPSMFGATPAYGFFVRHVKGLKVTDVDLKPLTDDARSPFVLEDVKGADFTHVDAAHGQGVPVLRIQDVDGLVLHRVQGMPDAEKAHVDAGSF